MYDEVRYTKIDYMVAKRVDVDGISMMSLLKMLMLIFNQVNNGIINIWAGEHVYFQRERWGKIATWVSTNQMKATEE